MFFGFQLTCGLMLVFYGYSVMKNPRVWGDQGRQAVKAENFPEYCRQNGLFFLKAGFIMALIGALDALVTLSGLLYVLLYLFGLAFAFYPLTRWCKENEGFSWPWPRVESEKKRIKKLRRQRRPVPHTALCPHPLRHCGLSHLGSGRRAAAVLSAPAHPGVQRGHGRRAGPLRPGSSFLNRSLPIQSPMAFGQTEPQQPGRPLVRRRQAPYSRLPVPGKARAVCLTEPGSATESGHRAHWRKSHRPAPGQPR